jgi:hypothetical protein
VPMIIDELGQLAADILLPDASPDLNALFDKKNPDLLRVPLGEPDGFRRRLNASGWFDDEVLAGGLLTQGKAQSLTSMMTGWALVELAKRKRCKSLPREFCVVVTAGRVVAHPLKAWSEGSGGELSGDTVVRVKREPVACWSRGEIHVEPDGRSLRTGYAGGTLDLGAGERVPVTWDKDTETARVIELLAG